MIIHLLNDCWELRPADGAWSVPAQVPGSVYYDLMKAGKMEDPFYRDNELKTLQVTENDYEFVKNFDVPQDLAACGHVRLRFEGIDTLSDIYLNGTHLAHTDNMHRTWEFDVRALVRPQGNELRVVLHSPTRYIQEMYEADPIDGSSDAMRGFPHLRKAHCMFGWDWGPRLPDMGIFRDVILLGFDQARIDSVYVTQIHEKKKPDALEADKVTLQMDVQLQLDPHGIPAGWSVDPSWAVKPDGFVEHHVGYGLDPKLPQGMDVCAVLTDPDGADRELTPEELRQGVCVEAPQLWWPNGYGKQPLYTVEVKLMQDGCCVDSWKKRIGLRTMTMHIEKDAWGEQFCHEVNGVRIFAMGGDYIPEDNLLPRITPQRTYQLLKQAKEANYNCVRVWGGGFYPNDSFWDACDELGLVVWEDFMFACAVYHLTPAFEASIRAEIADNIKRIRHHASLGLWCGNNEMEMFVHYGEWVSKPSERTDYVKMYEYVIPQLVETYDPNTFYWPASPSSGGHFDEPNDENRGDVHYWDVWHGNKPITEYRKFYFRYLSEFGFQSFPAVRTCETFTLPEDRNIFSYVMEKHQRNSSANGKIMNYMEQTFLYPTSFDAVIYASQLLQAEAIRYGIEHFRRNRGRCMGTVVWQLNDCWPVASWASIDYCGRWKALHYMEKRAFAPLLLSCAEEGILTQDTNPNAQPYEVKKSFRLNLSSELLADTQATVRWALRDAQGAVLREGAFENVTVPALSAIWLDEVDCMDADLYSNYVSYSCEQDGRETASGTVLFTAPKQFRFADPQLAVRVEGDEIVVSAGAYARSVEIRNEQEDLVLSDNYFDMNGGERRVRILSGNPDGVKVRSVYDIR